MRYNKCNMYMYVCVCVYVKWTRVRTASVDAAATTHPRGIKFPFWVLRVHPPSAVPSNISRGIYTVELASDFRVRDADPDNKLKSSSLENFYTTSNKYNFVKFRHLLYIRGSRSFRHIIPQPFSGFFPSTTDVTTVSPRRVII